MLPDSCFNWAFVLYHISWYNNEQCLYHRMNKSICSANFVDCRSILWTKLILCLCLRPFFLSFTDPSLLRNGFFVPWIWGFNIMWHVTHSDTLHPQSSCVVSPPCRYKQHPLPVSVISITPPCPPSPWPRSLPSQSDFLPSSSDYTFPLPTSPQNRDTLNSSALKEFHFKCFLFS